MRPDKKCWICVTIRTFKKNIPSQLPLRSCHPGAFPKHPKKAGRRSIWCPLWFLEKSIFQRKGETLFFVTFDIIIIYFFSENLVEIPQVVQKIWKFYSSILTLYRPMSPSYRNQSGDLLCKSINWFLYDGNIGC